MTGEIEVANSMYLPLGRDASIREFFVAAPAVYLPRDVDILAAFRLAKYGLALRESVIAVGPVIIPPPSLTEKWTAMPGIGLSYRSDTLPAERRARCGPDLRLGRRRQT